MFDWLKKALGDSEPDRRRRRDSAPEFKPAKLPPRRSEQTQTATSSSGLRSVLGASVASQRITNPVDEMKVDERVFTLTLPGRWSRLPPSDDTRWTYRSDREQLTVSLLSSTHCMSNDEQVAMLLRVTELRRRAEAETPGMPAVNMTDTTFAESGGVHAARFAGFESGSQRHFHCLLLCSPSAVTVFYYEAIGMTQQECDLRARPIFNSVSVA